MFAVAWGKDEMIAWLRDRGAIPAVASAENVRPIDLALALNRDDLAKMLQVPTDPPEEGEKMPRAAIDFLGDLFSIPEPLQVFVSLNDAEPPDGFTQAIARRRDQTFPMSMAKHDPTRMVTHGDTRVWFSNRISDEMGVRLGVTTKPLPAQNGWEVVCKLEGRPVKVTSGVEAVPMPVEKITGRLIQRHGWWVLEGRQPALRNPVPAPPKAELRQADLMPLAAETCWVGNISLMTAMMDAGVDPAAAINPGDDYTDTLLERAATSSNPRFMAAMLEKKPSLRANHGLIRKAAQRAFGRGNEAALASLERPLSGVKAGDFPVEMINDLVSENVLDSKEPLFFELNDADPEKEVMAQIQKSLPTAVPFSEAVSGAFKQGKDEVYGSSYQLKSTQKNGTKIEIKISPEKDGSWSYSVRQTRGFLAGGGTKGRLVSSHGYWFTQNTQSWDE